MHCDILTLVKLVIVESPTKAKTLSAILGKDYIVKASMGHIRDLPKSGLGVDIEHDFAPEYIVPDKAKKTLAELKKYCEDVESIVLATDPDREGEAISWHISELLSGKKKSKTVSKFSRVVFHELTKSAIEEAFNHPGKLDMHLVDAQQARRVLDRLVGYKLSPLLWKKVRYGLSAGRVQSVAVRLVVERERERQAFKPDEYWSVDCDFVSDTKHKLTASLVEFKSKKLEIGNEKQANKIKADLVDDSFEVSEVKKTERKKNPYPPLRTSTLQQMASNVYGFTAKRTMQAAQGLFERGYITYHRTDSLNLSGQFVGIAREFISKEFGAKYLPEKGVFYKTTSKNAQEAHEAIRPTNINLIPNRVSVSEMTDDEKKVYSLVWKRAVESQVLPAVYDQTSVSILSKKGYGLRASGSVVKFDGWLAISKLLNFSTDDEEIHVLDEFSEGQKLALQDIKMEQHFTQPPARYSDATLIKALEELGIGRPSTYAPTLMTIQLRGYVVKEAKYFVPQDVSYVVIDLLVKYFSDVVDYQFTAGMEESLDSIAAGEKDWVPVIRDFYIPFEKNVAEKDKLLKKTDITSLGTSEEKCPECGKGLIIKLGKYGKFLSCSGYPDCEFAKPMEEMKVLDNDGNEVKDFGKCENCDDGVMILKMGRFGKFLACSNYPKCKTAKPFEEKIGLKCPKCGEGEIVVRKAKRRSVFYGCNKYPACDFSSWTKPTPESIAAAGVGDAKGGTSEKKKRTIRKKASTTA